MYMEQTKRILIIEDEDDLRDSLVESLTGLGFTVIPIAESEEALSNLKVIKPDLIVLDLFTHSIHGIHFLERLQSLDLDFKFKVIVLTNSSNDEHRSKAEELGVADYLIKADSPISQILAVVKENLA